MIWIHPLLVLPLLLLLLPLLCVPTETDDRKVVLLAPSEVHGSPGDTVNLTCVLQPVESEILRVKQIKWERLNAWGDLSTVVEFHWDQGPSIEDPDHVQFVAAGKDQEKPLLDASLTLTDLEFYDKANYTCEVTTFQQRIGRASTWLRIFDEYDRKVVLLAPSEVHGSPGDTVNLTCVLQPVESEVLRVKQIKWERLDAWGDLSTVAEFHWDQGPSIEDPDHVQFVAAGKDQGRPLLDASLTLTDLEFYDEANYTCEVTTFQQGIGRASTWLRIFDEYDRKVVLLAPSEVHGSPGDTVNLTCVLQPVESEILRVKQIKWERLDAWGDLSTVAEFHWDQGPSIEDPDHVQFVAAGKDQERPLLDASLTLTDLEFYDEAHYTCEVTTFQQGIGRASTWLRIFDEYAPQVSIFLDDNLGQESRETSLSCYADSNPEPIRYVWSTTTGSLPPYAVPQDNLLLLQPSEPINITFICTVFNALGKGQDSINVLLPGPCSKQFLSPLASKESRSSSFLIISLLVALMVVVLVALVLVAMIYFWFSRKLRQGQRSTLENEAFLLCPQDRIASEHCRIKVENKAENESGFI